MKKRFSIAVFIATFLFIFSCSPPKYFHDSSSFERQKELKKDRSGNVVSDIGIGILSTFSSAAFEVDLGWYPSEQEFKNIKLNNPSNDTIYVNMLTDVYWDENNYCDFMDIRIPPNEKGKVLVPLNANYNLYFSNTAESDDDEMLEIFTNDIKKISLKPGLTVLNDSTNLKQ
jgi:hypothetical protein